MSMATIFFQLNNRGQKCKVTSKERNIIVNEIRSGIIDNIREKPLRRKGDSMYIQGAFDAVDLIEEILKEHVEG